MPLTAPPLEDAIAHSPRLYAFPFKSAGDRFRSAAAEKESTQLSYEIKAFDTVTGVNQSPRKLAHIFNKPKELTSEEIDVPVYNIDCGPNKTLHQSMLDSKRRYAFNLTDTRFKDAVKRMGEDRYDTNKLHKAGIEKRIEESPRKYSIMRSQVERDKDSTREVYNDYTPRNYDLETVLEKSERKYSIMRSKVPRDKGQMRTVHPGVYNVDVLDKAGIATEAMRKPGCVSTFKNTPRKPLRDYNAAPDKIYNVECGSKKSMWNALLESPRKYSNMAHSGRVDAGQDGPISKDLLYETEDVPVKPTLAFGVLRTPRLYSNMASATPRFPETVSAAAQALYDPDSAPRGEGSIQKRIMESPRRYFGAQSMTNRSMLTGSVDSRQLYYDVHYGRYMGVADCIHATPLQYSNVRSLIPRFKAERKAAAMDEYELLLRNPDRIDLKFQIRGNLVVKKTSDRAMLVVGRQAPAPS